MSSCPQNSVSALSFTTEPFSVVTFLQKPQSESASQEVKAHAINRKDAANNNFLFIDRLIDTKYTKSTYHENRNHAKRLNSSKKAEGMQQLRKWAVINAGMKIFINCTNFYCHGRV